MDIYPLDWKEVPTMGKHRTPYPAEFRAQMVELVKAGRTPEELEKEAEPTAQNHLQLGGAGRSRHG